MAGPTNRHPTVTQRTTGGSQVYPGKTMLGRMGGQQVTTQNVKVVKVDNNKGIIMLHSMYSFQSQTLIG